VSAKITFEKSANELFVNATQMAKPFGKRVAKFLELPSTISFRAALNGIQKSDTVDNQVITRSGGTGGGGGTWMCEDLALEFARWLSPEFAIWCNEFQFLFC